MAALATAPACAPVAKNTSGSIAYERSSSSQLVRKLDASDKLIRDRRLQGYVNRVVARIAATRPRGSVPVRAVIVKDGGVNAFTTGGGYIFFNAGMLAALENEAQLATVAAHEIAHIDRGHLQASQATRTAVGIGAALATIGAAVVGIDPYLTRSAVGLGANAAVSGFSREQESDADDVGLRYLAAAGYNAIEGARAFEVLRRIHGGGASFLSSHPAPGNRQARMTAQARAVGATRGRIGRGAHDRATRALRRAVLDFYDRAGRPREAAQVRRNLR